MKERPILFSGEMVRAILSGRKSQTRRVIGLKSFQKTSGQYGVFFRDTHDRWNNITDEELLRKCPYGQPGDRLWVRETYNPGLMPERGRVDGYMGCVYKADDPLAIYSGGWTPSIFMPRRHSRITLDVAKVRVERVQSISHNDACVEGAPSEPELNDYGTGSIYVDWYAQLWDKINAKRGYGWKVNPWVWVVEFEKVEGDEHAI